MERIIRILAGTLVTVSILLGYFISPNCNGDIVNEIPELSIVTDKAPGGPALHGLNKLIVALRTKNISFERVESVDQAQGKSVIVSGLAYGEGPAQQILAAGNHTIPKVSEALTIRKTDISNKPVWLISGFDERGLMYGLLDVSERISWSNDPRSPMSEVREITEMPDVKERAVSMYTMNRSYWESRFYDETYWVRYLDMMAKNRLNTLTVIFGYATGGFLAPVYPYFFNVEEFPGVEMGNITPEQQQRNLLSLNRLIKMAHDRGIRFKVGIWNHIHRGGSSGGRVVYREGEVPGVSGINSGNLRSYTKAALAKFVRLVPDLDGIQFRLHYESGLKRSEMDTFWSNVFQLINEVSPNLNFELRAKGLPDSIIQSAIDEGIKFNITTKYWMEQMGMPFHSTHINRQNQHDRRHGYADLLSYPKKYDIYWKLWNGGTTRVLLWGDPEFARRFVKSTHLYDGDSYEVNEPLATKMHGQPHDAEPFELLQAPYQYYEYEFERYWHFFQVFGRLGYNPDTPKEIWEKEFRRRFGKEAGPLVEEALHKASWILPRIVASVYPYIGFPTTRGWPEKQRLGNLSMYSNAEGSDIQQFASFDEEARILITGEETAKILPSMTSKWFEQVSADINNLVSKAEKADGIDHNKEFQSTITDLKILSNLALYHSRRIPAAVSYRLFKQTQDVSALEDAIEYEGKAIEAWRQIVNAAGDIYADNLMLGFHLTPVINHDSILGNLDGHWGDERVLLENGLMDLEQERINFKPEGQVIEAPEYKAADRAHYHKLFEISHQPVTRTPVGKPLTVKVKANAPAGVKWVKLRYRHVTQFEDYKSLVMEYDKYSQAYIAEIPGEFVEYKWDLMYFIEVMDNKGHGLIYPDLHKESPYIIIKTFKQ